MVSISAQRLSKNAVSLPPITGRSGPSCSGVRSDDDEDDGGAGGGGRSGDGGAGPPPLLADDSGE